MSDDTANRRLEAISRQVSASGSADASSSASLPKLVKVAGESTAPRAAEKVVIITGRLGNIKTAQTGHAPSLRKQGSSHY